MEGGSDPKQTWISGTAVLYIQETVETVKISFNKFQSNFSGGMNFLRRRFSSGDLQGELRDSEEQPSFLANFTKRGPSPSAPSSPSKGPTVQGLTRGLFGPSKPAYNKDRCKSLLVIDDQHTDW